MPKSRPILHDHRPVIRSGLWLRDAVGSLPCSLAPADIAGSLAIPLVISAPSHDHRPLHLACRTFLAGGILLKEFLEPAGITQTAFVEKITWTRTRLNELRIRVRCDRMGVAIPLIRGFARKQTTGIRCLLVDRAVPSLREVFAAPCSSGKHVQFRCPRQRFLLEECGIAGLPIIEPLRKRSGVGLWAAAAVIRRTAAAASRAA